MAVRSKVLALGRYTGASPLLYTVPADRLTIVRSVSILQMAAAAAILALRVDRGATQTVLHPIVTVSTAFQGLRIDSWFTLAEGDELHLLNTQASGTLDVSVHVSGAELVL